MAAMQSLMPGQAQGFQFAPPQAKGTPSAVVQQYSGMPLDELVQEYMRNPSIQLLARIDEVRKQDQARAAVQGQLAQQQAQQQQGTVANETLMQAAQAAQPQQMPGMQGMPVRRMATGGIVALQQGGDPEVQRILAKPPYQRTQEENAKLEAAGIPLVQRNLGPSGNWIERLNRFLESPFIRETFTGGAERLSDTELRQRTDAGAVTERIARGLGAQQVADTAPTAQPSIPGPRNRPGGEGVAPAAEPVPTPSPRRPTRENDGKPSAPPPAATPAVDPRMQAFLALTAASQPQGVSPELQAQRERVSGIQALQEQQAMEDARRIREEVVRTGQRRMDRANLPLLEDTQALAALMGSIDPTKGRLFGSLGTGLASVLGAREARKEKAEEYVSAGSEKVRQLNNTYRQLQLETAKYQEARLANDAKTARESAEKIAALRYKFETESAELEIKRSEARAKTIAAGAQAAAVPSRIDAATQGATARLAAVLNSDSILQGYRKRLEGALISPEDEAALLTKMRARERELLLQYAPELAALRQTAGAGTTGASTARAEADKIIQGQQ